MIELMIPARRKDLGGFEVGRVLPWTQRRMVPARSDDGVSIKVIAGAAYG